MSTSIAPERLHHKILTWAAIGGLFFGLMPPYVFTIVMVATWGVKPEPFNEQTFRGIYYLRLVLGNTIGLTAGAFLAAFAAHWGLKIASKATYARGALGGAVLGAVVGALTAGSCPLFLLISSTDPEWAWTMIQRSILVGGLMGMTNGFFAGLVIVYFIRREQALAPPKRE